MEAIFFFKKKFLHLSYSLTLSIILIQENIYREKLVKVLRSSQVTL